VIERIFIGLPKANLLHDYENYKARVGNEKRLWHGTTSKCLIGIDLNTSPCSDAKCPVCNICRSSFIIFSAAQRNFGDRFGRGIYFAPNSSKSNDYITQAPGSGNKRVMFLCRVALGKEYVVTQDNPNLNAGNINN
jgi:hypothetical protein